MSSIIIGKIEGLKLQSGKVIPFLLSASSNVRIAGNSLAWDWHSICLNNGKGSFMFEKAEELRPKIEDWANQGVFKWRNGGFINVDGMMKKLSEVFKKPQFFFEEGLVMVSYTHVSKDKTKAEHVIFKPKTENDFLAYMEKNKNKSITINLLAGYDMKQNLTALSF